MLDEDRSNRLWEALKARAAVRRNRLYEFSSRPHGVIAVAIQCFTIKKEMKGGRIEVKRNYYRMVRDEAGSVLYDQLEGVPERQVTKMIEGNAPVPDIAISPGRSNSLLRAVLEQQAEVDELIGESKIHRGGRQT